LVLKLRIYLLQVLLVEAIAVLKLLLELLKGDLLVSQLLVLLPYLVLQATLCCPVLVSELLLLLSQGLCFLQGLIILLSELHFFRLEVLLLLLDLVQLFFVFQLQLVFVLLLHLVEEIVDFLLVLALKHLEFDVVLGLNLLNLGVQDVFVVTNLDHVLLHGGRELVYLPLELLDDLALLSYDEVLLVLLVVQLDDLRLQVVAAGCKVSLQRVYLPLLVLDLELQFRLLLLALHDHLVFLFLVATLKLGDPLLGLSHCFQHALLLAQA